MKIRLTTLIIGIILLSINALSSQKMANEIQLSALFEGEQFLDSTTYWEGEFNNQIPVGLALGYLDNEVHGYIYFANSEDVFLVRGLKVGDNYHLAEYFEDRFHSANIHLRFRDKLLKGTWSNVSNSLNADLSFRKAKSKSYLIPKNKISYGLFSYSHKDNQLLSIDEYFGGSYFTLYNENSAYSYRGPDHNPIIIRDMKNGRLIKAKSRGKTVKSFELPNDIHINFFESVDSMWVESSFKTDYFQTIYINQPLCKTAPDFNKYINSITNDWKSKLLTAQISKPHGPADRWTHVGQIWFEPYYFANGIISGALYLKSNLIDNQVKCISYNLKKDEAIKTGYWLQREDKLLKNLEINSNDAQFCLSPKGIIICRPYSISYGHNQKWVPAAKVWKHFTTKAKLFGMIKRK